MVRRSLDIGLAAQGINTTAANSHIAEEQLDDGHGPDVLAADCMMGPAQGITLGSGLIFGKKSDSGIWQGCGVVASAFESLIPFQVEDNLI
jgi:hypothetical protein